MQIMPAIIYALCDIRRALAVLLTLTGGLFMAPAHATSASAHDFSFTAIDGTPLPLSQFEGKAVLVVNTASRCGFTPQYEGLQALYDEFAADGLVVLGVPSNDFGAQEKGSNEEIKEFCAVNFNITFPMTEKENVKGSTAHPFYGWASAEAGMLGRPKWNFHKYLIGPDGRFVTWFSSLTSPDSEKLRRAIIDTLPAVAQKAS